jgi:hypothetical protein
MPHESLRSHALDRRLIRRRGWITPVELEKQLANLPDVADRIAEPEDVEDAGGGSPSPEKPAISP